VTEQKPSHMTIRDFLATEDAPDVRALAENMNSGAFMNCHCAAFAENGVWIDELVPVFRKLDAQLAVANDRKVAALTR
jgi:hypothetical protein